MESITDIISEIKDAILNCSMCVGHPECEFADTKDCDNCMFTKCPKVVCRFCHPNDFPHLSPYYPEGEYVSEDKPCDEVIPLFIYDSFGRFEGVSVPEIESELIDVLLSLPESGNKAYPRQLDNLICGFRKAALTYVDYTLLKRSLNGAGNLDATALYNTLDIVYSRDELKNSIDPREWAALTKGSIKTCMKNFQAPVLTKTSVAQDIVNYNNLWNLLEIRDDYKSIFVSQLKDCRKRYKKGAKGKNPQEHTTLQDFIALGYALFNLNFKKKTGSYRGCRPFISQFLDILCIPHGDIKLPSHQESERIAHSMIASLDFMKQ